MDCLTNWLCNLKRMLEILTIQMYVYDIYMYGYLCFKGCIVSILTSEKENIISIYIKVKFQDFLSVMSVKSHLLSLLILFIITIIFFLWWWSNLTSVEWGLVIVQVQSALTFLPHATRHVLQDVMCDVRRDTHVCEAIHDILNLQMICVITNLEAGASNRKNWPVAGLRW